MGLGRSGWKTIAAIVPLLAHLGVRAEPPPAPPAEAPVAVEASALYPVDTERSLSILGIKGRVSVGANGKKDVRWVSHAPGPNGAELPLGIWQVDDKLILAPPPGDKNVERQVELEVPPGLSILIDGTDSEVLVASSTGSVELRGTNSRATIAACHGPIETDLQGGTLTVSGSDSADLRVRGTALTVAEMGGNVDVHATGGTVSLVKVAGLSSIESENAGLMVDASTGPLHVKAHKGSAKIGAIKGGAELSLSDTTLNLKGGAGDITVTSDASVQFEEMGATLHFDMYGGTLKGKGNQGSLEVRTRNTEVNVEGIVQGMRVQGEGLKAKIADVSGELYIETSNSDVAIDRAAVVILKIDRGTVTVQRALGDVQAEVVGADVHISDGSGAVTLDLDGGDADVSWASISSGKDMRLTNKTGSITVGFPSSGPCRVEAKSEYGRIESDLPSVTVTDDGRAAQGPVNGGTRPFIRIVAYGDIRLNGGSRTPSTN